MAKPRATFGFDNHIIPNLDTLSDKVDRYVHGVVSYSADRCVGFMKQNAKWTDRTGAARAGLRAEPEWQPKKLHAIHLFHSVLYGIWLEIRFGGKYGIIIPTLNIQGPATMRLLSKLFAKLKAGGIA